jgi:CMP-N,N'-diacetyllegionaminic acid synthase
MNIAFIPARSGSKGVPDKNIYPLWGKTLLWWAAQCAIKSGAFDRVILSTDSEKYAQIGIDAGCEIPGLRAANLASDTSKIADTILEFLESKKETYPIETLCILEPTCPLRTPQMLQNGAQYFQNNPQLHSLVSVSEVPVKYHPLKQFYRGIDNRVGFTDPKAILVANRQELLPTYIRNGAFYFINCESFKSNPAIVTENSAVFPISESLINIDSFDDIKNLEVYTQSSSPDWHSEQR